MTTRDDVLLAPVQPSAAAPFVPAPVAPQPEPAPQHHAGPFVPPRPAAPVSNPALARAPRMPQIHELPPIAQNQLMASRAAEDSAPESKRTSLLRRLATVGFGGRREDEVAPAQRAAAMPPAPPAPAAYQPPMPPAPRAPVPPAPQYRPAQGNLDGQGRAMPQQPRMMDDDQLEIPAFLRRQAN